MSKSWKIIIVTGVLLLTMVVVFLSGPEFSVETKIDNINLPENLDEYLQKKESKFSDITTGAEKKIIWADQKNKRTEYSIIYIHGFSATRQEITPVCDDIAKKIGANLFYTRIAGHGRGSAPMGEATTNQWLNDGVEALRIGERIGEKVIIISTSTGSTLSAWLEMKKQYNKKIYAMVMISPNFYPKDPFAGIVLWPWGMEIARAIIGDTREWKPVNDAQAKYWTYKYKIEVVFNMMGLVDIVDEMNLKDFKTPLLIIHTNFDKVVSVEKIHERFAEIGSSHKRRVEVNDTISESGHVLVGDITSPNTIETVEKHISDFLESVEKL